jgi:hypothetical protein
MLPCLVEDVGLRLSIGYFKFGRVAGNCNSLNYGND